MPLYEPQEDSELLKRAVLAHARGDVLDMGSGSGILAEAAASKHEVSSVLAVDVDEESVAHLKTIEDTKITALESDLFRSLEPEDRFDTIIFNPPYLPAEEDDEHRALYGGRHGYELILRFLDDARTRLKPGGCILLLFSSLSNKGRIDAGLKGLGYHAKQLLMEAHFFERLYAYKLWRD